MQNCMKITISKFPATLINVDLAQYLEKRYVMGVDVVGDRALGIGVDDAKKAVARYRRIATEIYLPFLL